MSCFGEKSDDPHSVARKADAVPNTGQAEEAAGISGIDRRDFLIFCTKIAALLGLSNLYVPQIAAAVEKAALKPSVIWLHFQECTGDSEAFIRSSKPDIAELVLDILSVDYHETLMAASGDQCEELLKKTIAENKGNYFVICEGALPTATPPGPGAKAGDYLTIGGRSGIDVAKEVCKDAKAVVCVGSCASYGGVQAQKPNPTGAKGVGDALGISTVNLPGCPHNVVNSVATIVHYLLLGRLPEVDKWGRPKFAYGKRIHDQCTRRAHFDAGQFVESFGSPEAEQGFCLYKMGCKGPETYHNCNLVRYNNAVGWPIGAGHGCVGCSEPDWWDRMQPFYERLPNVEVPFTGIETTADKVGFTLVGAAVAGMAVHAATTLNKGKDIDHHVTDENDPKNGGKG